MGTSAVAARLRLTEGCDGVLHSKEIRRSPIRWRPMLPDPLPLVRYDVHDSICVITLDDPDHRNAWSPSMETQYFSMLDRAGQDPEVRAIVVTGAGNWFCPGLDSQRLEDAAGPAGLRLEGRRPMHYGWTVPKPMIAAINGACAGIGLVQALVCDVRFVARGARISTAYAKLGSSCGTRPVLDSPSLARSGVGLGSSLVRSPGRGGRSGSDWIGYQDIRAGDRSGRGHRLCPDARSELLAAIDGCHPASGVG